MLNRKRLPTSAGAAERGRDDIRFGNLFERQFHMADRIATFSEFWLYYLREHSKVACRVTHYVGTAASLAVFALAIFVSPWFLPLALVAGYGPAWFGHFVIEKNRPATFDYPRWSLIADYKMFGLALIGRLRPELERAGVSATSRSAAN